jgi:uncharacterized membrane protein
VLGCIFVFVGVKVQNRFAHCSFLVGLRVHVLERFCGVLVFEDWLMYLLKTLYPSKVPIVTLSEDLDGVERVALGIRLSIALVAIDGLILNYTPLGIRLMPVTLSLFVLTLVFSVVGVFRECPAKAMKLN